eukprot:5675062-Pyramimonas_sp.AAC.1
MQRAATLSTGGWWIVVAISGWLVEETGWVVGWLVIGGWVGNWLVVGGVDRLRRPVRLEGSCVPSRTR